MKKALITLSLISALVTGCRGTVSPENSPPLKESIAEPIAAYETIPEALQLPTYPEKPLRTQTKEYEDGWRAELVVPNPLAIAKPAWLNRFTEVGWKIEEDIVFENQKKQWVHLKNDSQNIFIQFEEARVTAEEPALNTNEERVVKGETTIVTYVKK